MNIIKWILYFVIALAIVFIVDFLFRKKQKLSHKIIGIIIKLILSLACAFLPLGGPLFLRPIQGVLVALYIVLFCDALNGIIFIFIKKNKFVINKVVSFVLSLILFIYGTININIVKVNEHIISTDKVNNDYSFVFLSDVHVGDSQTENARTKMIETIKSLDIDFVVLGGDITDDYTSKDDMIKFYSYFKDFNVPVYFVYGNHDTQDDKTFHAKDTYNKDELIEVLNENGIVILDDNKGTLSFNELDLIGRDDKSRNNNRLTNDDLDINENNFTICFDHQPCDLKGSTMPNVDLQVSGHTHAGQFAPLGMLYDLVLSPSYGEYTFDDKTLIVSSGASGWRVPFRTDHNSEIELIHIKKSPSL